MDFFLKAKAWQIFLLIVVVPFGFQSTIMVSIISSIETNPELIFKVMPLLTIVFMGVFLLWFWSLGVGLNKRLPEEIQPKIRFFKFGIIYSAVYMLLFQALFIVFAAGGGKGGGYMAIIFPLHLFAMYCIFYALHFICKNLAIFEEQQTVKFSTFAGTFFLLWFFPIGIWFIQPRINKVYIAKNT